MAWILLVGCGDNGAGGGSGGTERTGGTGGSGSQDGCGPCTASNEGERCEVTTDGCPTTQICISILDEAPEWQRQFPYEAGDPCTDEGVCCSYAYNSGDHCDSSYDDAKCVDGQWVVDHGYESCGGEAEFPTLCSGDGGGGGSGGGGSGGGGSGGGGR